MIASLIAKLLLYIHKLTGKKSTGDIRDYKLQEELIENMRLFVVAYYSVNPKLVVEFLFVRIRVKIGRNADMTLL